MSGHNKWSQIKHKKAKEDAKKGKIFTTLSKDITVAAQDGGGDPAMNSRLRTLLEKARMANMPIENVKRAIKKGTGELGGSHYEAYMYEGYGPHGVAVIVETLSDNKNRTIADVRHIFSRYNGTIGETGSVGWMFEKMGVIRIAAPDLAEDQLLEALIDFDVQDMRNEEGSYTISCSPKSFDGVKKRLEEMGVTIEHAEIEWVAKTSVSLVGEQSEKVIEFLNALEELDDVKNVYANIA